MLCYFDSKFDGFQILPDNHQKPQAKHLQTRLDYLLQVLQKHSIKSSRNMKSSKVFDFGLIFIVLSIHQCRILVNACLLKSHVRWSCYFIHCGMAVIMHLSGAGYIVVNTVVLS